VSAAEGTAGGRGSGGKVGKKGSTFYDYCKHILTTAKRYQSVREVEINILQLENICPNIHKDEGI